MELSQLLSHDGVTLHSNQKVECMGITSDSRQVKPGYLFVALTGSVCDGRQFIPGAIEQGAIAVLTDILPDDWESHENICWAVAQSPRHIYALATAAFYTKQPKVCAAVTGTNGKSSVVHFCRQLWEYAHLRAASLGTLGVEDTEGRLDHWNDRAVTLTTPDPSLLHPLLSEMVEVGIDHVAMEASSHGLEQCRLDGAKITIGAFTSFSRDHLDYHQTEEAYLQAKERLFSEVMVPGGVVVLNADMAEYPRLKELCEKANHRIIDVGVNASAIRIHTIETRGLKQYFSFTVENKNYEITTSLIGRFQIENMLCALGIVMASGVSVDVAVEGLSHLSAVPGRMECAGDSGKASHIVVDYAHTPDALMRALQALQPHVEGKLAVLFGCGGDRDKGKRALMGTVASGIANQVYITDDNPRYEEAEAIRLEIQEGCHGKEAEVYCIENREKAIAQAIASMQKGDVLLIAGKGHEPYQLIQGEKFPFHDISVVQSYLENEPHLSEESMEGAS